MEDGHAYIASLEPGPVHAVYQVAAAKALKARNGKPYLALTLRDNSGRIEAKRWDVSDHEAGLAAVGGFLEIQGEVELYRNTPQVVIRALRVPAPEDVDHAAFETKVSFDPAQLAAEVRQLLLELPDADLRALAQAYLDDEVFMARFEVGPAAERMHHPYRFGLLEHVHSVLHLGVKLCDHYPWLDRSMVILGLFLHDSGKVVELTGEDTPGYSIEGELLGHITIGINMLDRKLQALPDFPHAKGVLLKHIILSHHGQADYGSPKPTMTPEALAVHTVEMLDAKMNAFLREQAEPPEHSDILGGIRYSRLLKHKIITRPKTPPG
ncbi:MAG: HD domain-containing protein [Planctomycetes bacterium]|jgi:3'-5' exoribonuclease|nr:HD domain-containing protein [Planctomycetota bacterium]MCL4730133.1 HD domain-containing protein [Planctomycetota bacterium]